MLSRGGSDWRRELPTGAEEGSQGEGHPGGGTFLQLRPHISDVDPLISPLDLRPGDQDSNRARRPG